MKGFHIAVILTGATLASAPAAAAAAPVPVPQQAQAESADSLYRRARRALDDKDYSLAARLFDGLARRHPRSQYASDAFYWKGFALFRNGELDPAVAALELQAQHFPNAATRSDAAALLIQVRREQALRGNPAARREIDSAASSQGNACEDMDVRIAALDALQQMDSERVLPLLRRILARRDDCSLPLRKNALFILAQKAGAERDRILLDIAKQDGEEAVRKDAVFYLGQARNPEAVDALEDILLNGNNTAVRSDALFALAQRGTDRARRILMDFAARDAAPARLRKDALFHIAAQSGAEATKWLVSVVANANAPTDMRKDAIFYLAQRREAPDELAASYDGALPLALRKDILFHIAQRGDDKSVLKLIAIARTDPDRQMRKDATFYLGQSKDPRAMKALEELVIP